MGDLNGDMDVRATMHTGAMDWQASPSGTVWRKRVHLVGPPESGQVTSVVRYDPGASFPAHNHPQGEEILVLAGTFSDEHGDWSQGTYLLNPEGFRHAPFSHGGCTLLVKLRQYGGPGREHVVADTHSGKWQAENDTGVSALALYAGGEPPEQMCLQRFSPGATPAPRTFAGGAEYFVLEGELDDEHGRYPRWSWLRLPPGARHSPASESGCTVYVKTGAVAHLQSASA